MRKHSRRDGPEAYCFRCDRPQRHTDEKRCSVCDCLSWELEALEARAEGGAGDGYKPPRRCRPWLKVSQKKLVEMNLALASQDTAVRRMARKWKADF